MWRAALALALVAGTLAACGDDDAPAETVGAADASSADSTGPATGDTGGDPAADDGAAASAFFLGTEQACLDHAEATGNPAPEPHRFRDAVVDAQLEPGVWLVIDGEGDRLTVDVNQGTVASGAGPDVPLPLVYSFGCPPELYVGPAHD